MPCKEVYTQGGFAEDAVSQGQRRQSPSPLIGTAHLQRKGYCGSGASPSWSAFKPSWQIVSDSVSLEQRTGVCTEVGARGSETFASFINRNKNNEGELVWPLPGGQALCDTCDSLWVGTSATPIARMRVLRHRRVK